MSKRDNKRLEKIRLMICCACGADAPSQAAHSNFGIHGKAKGMKADDKYTIPLCHSCHGRLDKYEMGVNHDESIDWFNKKLASTNETLRRADDAAIQNYPECF